MFSLPSDWRESKTTTKNLESKHVETAASTSVSDECAVILALIGCDVFGLQVWASNNQIISWKYISMMIMLL